MVKPEIVSDTLIVSSSGLPVHGTIWRRRRPRSAHAVLDSDNGRYSKPEPEVDIVALDGDPQAEASDVTYRSMPEWNETAEAKYAERYTYVTKLLKIAHGLHYIGIGILAVFVVQVRRQHSVLSLLLICMRFLQWRSQYFKVGGTPVTWPEGPMRKWFFLEGAAQRAPS